MYLFSIALPFLFVTLVVGHGYGGGYGGGYQKSAGYSGEYDCGGTCGGGCSTGHCGESGPIIGDSGCETGECGGGGGRRASHTSSSQSGYHKSVTSVTKETRNDELKIIIGKPQQTVHRAAYIEQPQIIRKTTYIEPQPVIVKKTYVNDGDYAVSGCHGPCGGSKIVKVIKKTTYADGGGCNTCGSDYSGGSEYSGGYSGDVEYHSQPAIVTKKVTRIITQPKVVTTRVIKTRVVDEPSEFYEDSAPSYGGHGHRGGYGRQKSYGGGGGKAFAFASASAGAGAGSYGGDSGEYSGGGSGGCKSGCDQWKKK